jgi:hypothetical protein
MSRLLAYRKENPVLHSGKMVHFIPRDNVYVYFRMNAEKTIMVILNNADGQVSLDTARFEECLKGKHTGRDITSSRVMDIGSLNLEAKTALVLEIE